MAARSTAGLAASAFPAALLLSCAATVAAAVSWSSAWPLLGTAALLYLVPPLLHRLHDRFFPLVPGSHPVTGADYLPWWGSHQLQQIYIAAPALEALLRLVPGLYSAWLRLWGAQIGRAVYWTPRVQILDRSLLSVGDRVVFGHEAGLSSHVISHRPEGLTLYLQPITIGDGALIGARSVLAPGTTVDAGVTVLASQIVRINGRVA